MEFLIHKPVINTTELKKIKYFQKNAGNHLTNDKCNLIIWVSVLRHPYFILIKKLWFALTGKPYFYFTRRCNMKLNEENVVCIGVRIPKKLHTELTDIAAKKDLTLSQLVRLAIKKIIADNEQG